jgi:ZIP family zinc transporter
MSAAQTIALGAFSGLTIFLSLPLGRVRSCSPRVRVALAMFAVGILAFVLVDVLSQANQILGSALHGAKHGDGLARLVGLVLLLAVGFACGSAGLSVLERRMRSPRIAPPIAGGSSLAVTSRADLLLLEAQENAARANTLRTGLVIAAAIGLHNFAEGLSIGVSARAGTIDLAMVLIIGYALHNATEGFGIVGPLGGVVPSWRWLALAGLIAGGPTFLGSALGYQVTSRSLALAAYALAGGAIVYAIGEIWHGMRRLGHRELGMLMLSCGFVAGVVTDLIVTYGGG